MKLIIQIPCYNEAENLAEVISDLPREVAGVDTVEFLVIDDGSDDNTKNVAEERAVDHIVQHAGNFGLAKAFETGLKTALSQGADIIVNTDGDHQYRGEDIGRLIQPIVRGDADLVIGARQISVISHFSSLKKCLQRIGSMVVRQVSGLDVPDAPSGFRAFSRDAALRLITFGKFTYTIETLIQAGMSSLRVQSVTIEVNPPTRSSRLFRSQGRYILRAIEAILLTYLIYQPAKLFSWLGIVFGIGAMGLAIRYFYFIVIGEGTGHVQSVIASGVLAIASIFMFSLGVTAYLLGINRRLLEEIRYRNRFRDLAESRGSKDHHH